MLQSKGEALLGSKMLGWIGVVSTVLLGIAVLVTNGPRLF